MEKSQGNAVLLKRCVIGLCLNIFTLEFAYLDLILPFLGIVLILYNLLPLRTLNPSFRGAYITACISGIFLMGDIILLATPYDSMQAIVSLLTMIGMIFFLFLFASGIESIYTEAGIEEDYPMKSVSLSYVAYLAILLCTFVMPFIAIISIILAFLLLLRIAYMFFKSVGQLKTLDKSVDVSKHTFILPICVLCALLCLGSIYMLNESFKSYETAVYQKLTPADSDVQDALVKKGIPSDVVSLLDKEDAAVLQTKAKYDSDTVTIQQDELPEYHLTYYVNTQKNDLLILAVIDWKALPTTHSYTWNVGASTKTYDYQRVTKAQLYQEDGSWYHTRDNSDLEIFSFEKGDQRKSYFLIQYASPYKETLTFDIDLRYRNDAFLYPYKDLSLYSTTSFPYRYRVDTAAFPSYAQSLLHFPIIIDKDGNEPAPQDEDVEDEDVL